MTGASTLLVRGARIVPVDRPAPTGLVDLLLSDGVVTHLGPRLSPPRGARVLDADGRWAIPGLWDHHVHFTQWSLMARRIDTSGTASAEEVLDLVRARLASEGRALGRPGGRQDPWSKVLQGYGHRTATWPLDPTVAALDAVTGARPVVLVSGDAHHGWLNSAALALFGLPPREGVVAEDEWFPLFARLGALTDSGDALEAAVAAAARAAHARGIVGIVDLDWGNAPALWQARYAVDAPLPLRVRAGVYTDLLDDILESGLRTGSPLIPGSDLLELGPFKVISDGSLNTRTAFCHEPYAHSAHRGALNLGTAQLAEVLGRAARGGLRVAVHAIGDAALDSALEAIARADATGTIEHAQLLSRRAAARMATLGLTASVQPAHLWDDREAIAQYWPDRDQYAYAFRTLVAAGVPLALGSDAPVSPLDPWLAIAAAVHRSGDDRPPWRPEQSLTVAESLAASVDGQGTLRLGSRADLVLLEADPLEAERLQGGERAAYLRRMPCAATIVAGQVAHAVGVSLG